MFGVQEPEPQQPGEIWFHPMNADEYHLPRHIGGGQLPQGATVRPKYVDYQCGACGKHTSGRVLCDMLRDESGTTVAWCLCSCERKEPSLIANKDDAVISQLPLAREHHAGADWPANLRDLYEEAAKSYAAEAYTATAMLCRKLLMACACDKGDTPGKNFTDYVDYLTTIVLPYQAAKDSIDAIRDIGNQANHEIKFVAKQEAARAMSIVTYLLTTIYSLPSA